MESICDQRGNWRNGEIYNWSMAVEPKTFGERVAWLLRRRRTDGLPVSSQKELAAAMKISPQYLNALMNGRRAPNVQHLRAAATALGTSVSYLALATEDWSPDAAADADMEQAGYLSPEADEAAQLIDGMSEELRDIALDLIRVLALHDVEGDTEQGAPVPGTGGRLILGKLISNLKKSAPVWGPSAVRE